jgi:hypothetical protein
VKRVAAWLVALAPAALLVAAAHWTVRARHVRGTDTDAGSSYRGDERGTRALFVLLQESGHDVRRLGDVAPGGPGRLLAISPRRVSARADVALLRWVDEGGTLVLAGTLDEAPSKDATKQPDGGAKQPGKDAGGIDEEDDLAPREPPLAGRLGLSRRTGPAAPAGGPWAARPALAGLTSDSWWSSVPAGAEILLGDATRPVQVAFSRGRGRVFALADATWLENARLRERPTLALALDLCGARDRPLWFDEFRHGLGEDPGLAFVLSRYGLVPAAWAALVLMVLLAWRCSVAESAATGESDHGPPPRDARIEARASLVWAQLSPVELVEAVGRDVRAHLMRALGLPRGAPWRELRGALAAKRPGLVGRLDRVVAALGSQTSAPPRRHADVLPLAREAAHLTGELK